MLAGFVQKVYVRGILDVSGRNRRVHQKLAAVLLLTLLLLPGSILVRLSCLGLFFLVSTSCRWIVVVAAVVFCLLLFRSFSRADVLIDLRQFLKRETLAEMNHHGRVKQRLVPEFLQTEKVLNIRVLGNGNDSLFICQLFLLLHVD